MDKVNIPIYVNGKEYLIKKNMTLFQLINDLDLTKRSFALAVNNEVIKKENFHNFILLPNSKIEIISAVGGG